MVLISMTDTIPLFSLQTHEIKDSNKHFEHCVENILFRMKHYGSLVLDSLESMRYEYISTILHTALHIAEDDTGKEFSMRPEYEIIGDECCGRVDYAIIKWVDRRPRTFFVSQKTRSSVVYLKASLKISNNLRVRMKQTRKNETGPTMIILTISIVS